MKNKTKYHIRVYPRGSIYLYEYISEDETIPLLYFSTRRKWGLIANGVPRPNTFPRQTFGGTIRSYDLNLSDKTLFKILIKI